MNTVMDEQQQIQRVAQLLIHNGDTVVDVGMNVMSTTKIFLDLVQDSGYVIGIEPIKFLFEESLKLKNKTNARFDPHNTVLTDKQQLVTFREYKDNYLFGYSGIKSNLPNITLNSVYEEYEIMGTTLDNIINATTILGNLSLIKIDTEASDIEVVLGGIDTIEKYQPAIIIESICLPPEKKQKEIDFYSILRKFDYSIYLMSTLNKKRSFNSINNEINYLLVSNQTQKEILREEIICH